MIAKSGLRIGKQLSYLNNNYYEAFLQINYICYFTGYGGLGKQLFYGNFCKNLVRNIKKTVLQSTFVVVCPGMDNPLYSYGYCFFFNLEKEYF